MYGSFRNLRSQVSAFATVEYRVGFGVYRFGGPSIWVDELGDGSGSEFDCQGSWDRKFKLQEKRSWV